MNEELAVELIRKNDISGFYFIYDLYVKQIYCFVHRMTDNRMDAEEITSTVFFKFYKGIKKYDHGEKLLSFLFKIAHNHTIDVLRKRKNDTVSYDDTQISEEQMEEPVYNEHEISVLREGLEKIPQTARAMLILFYYEEFSVKDISKITKKTETAVKVALNRARNRLKEVIHER